MSSLSRSLLALVLLLFVAPLAMAEEPLLSFTIEAGEYDRANEPVCVPIDLPVGQAFPASVAVIDEAGRVMTAQITSPGLLSSSDESAELHFVLPELAAGESLALTAQAIEEPANAAPSFRWEDEPGMHCMLSLGETPVLDYMYEALDESTEDRRQETYKPYHHVYDPTGTRVVTKGPGGLFPHHRGLYYGFMKCSYAGGATADTWHCKDGAWEAHSAFLAEEAGPVLGRHLVAIDWHGQNGDVFAHELREMTVYATTGGRMIRFASRLHSTVGRLELDGDPQHAGFQFRASQDVPDETADQTYYLRPDGPGEVGVFRNWPDDSEHMNLPWNAISFVLGDQRYTACLIDRPENPKDSYYSERDYGRFGSFFVTTLPDNETPLDVSYLFWLQEGEMEVADVESLSHDFIEPVTVSEN